MTRNAWIIFSAIVVAIIGGLVFISQQDKVDVSDVDVSKIQTASDENGNIGDHVYGKADSPVVLIEYGDYQCPGCYTSYSVMKEVAEKYKDKIAFVYRNFPLVSSHPNAMISAAAVEAAGLQGKFWEMHDIVYSEQDSWKSLTGSDRLDYFKSLATRLELDVSKFETDMNGPEVSKKISHDRAMAQKSNISGTPAFYLNNESIEQWYKDDKIVASRTEGGAQVWSNADALSKFVIVPALKEHNIEVDE